MAENERRADAAGTDKAEHGRLADVDIEPIEHSRGKRRAELRQHRIADARQQRDAHGAQRVVSAKIERLDRLGEALAEQADAAHRERSTHR